MNSWQPYKKRKERGKKGDRGKEREEKIGQEGGKERKKERLASLSMVALHSMLTTKCPLGRKLKVKRDGGFW